MLKDAKRRDEIDDIASMGYASHDPGYCNDGGACIGGSCRRRVQLRSNG